MRESPVTFEVKESGDVRERVSRPKVLSSDQVEGTVHTYRALLMSSE